MTNYQLIQSHFQFSLEVFQSGEKEEVVRQFYEDGNSDDWSIITKDERVLRKVPWYTVDSKQGYAQTLPQPISLCLNFFC